MRPAQTYRTQNILAGLTRVEMLIALYDRAIMHTESLGRELQNGNPGGARFHSFKSQQMLNGIHAGIDQNGSELSLNLNRLLEFCSAQVAAEQPEPATRTLQILRDAWQQIREEANALETNGFIPSLDANQAALEMTV